MIRDTSTEASGGRNVKKRIVAIGASPRTNSCILSIQIDLISGDVRTLEKLNSWVFG
jgi:hypothetical protein